MLRLWLLLLTAEAGLAADLLLRGGGGGGGGERTRELLRQPKEKEQEDEVLDYRSPWTTRVACVGDSLTVGTCARTSGGYVSMLQSLLGEDVFDVINFGKSGRTMLRHSHCQPPAEFRRLHGAMADGGRLYEQQHAQAARGADDDAGGHEELAAVLEGGGGGDAASRQSVLRKHGASADSDCSYWETGLLDEVKESQPDIVIIMLGTNDAKAFNWFEGLRAEVRRRSDSSSSSSSSTDSGGASSREREYVRAYKEMVAQLQALRSRPRILLGVPPPLYSPYPYLMDVSVINARLPELIRQVASESAEEVQVVDLFETLGGRAQRRPELSCDGCHLTEEAYAMVAALFKDRILHMLHNYTAAVDGATDDDDDGDGDDAERHRSSSDRLRRWRMTQWLLQTYRERDGAHTAAQA